MRKRFGSYHGQTVRLGKFTTVPIVFPPGEYTQRRRGHVRLNTGLLALQHLNSEKRAHTVQLRRMRTMSLRIAIVCFLLFVLAAYSWLVVVF